MNFDRRMVLSALAAILALAAAPAVAADAFMTRTVRLMVAFPAGGGQDLVARVLAPKISESIGQPVVVENSSGGAGFVGILNLVNSKPDGTVLLINTMGMAVN